MKRLFRTALLLLFVLSCLVFSCCATPSATEQNGSVWYSGTDMPSASEGAAGDYYIDFSSGTVYEKTANGWTICGTLPVSGTDSGQGQVKITFDADGGELPNGYLREMSVEKGDSLALPVPTRAGYRFLGWFYGAGVNGGQATDLTVFARDTLLTAKWQKLRVVTLTAEQPHVSVGEGFLFAGEYDGTDTARFTLFLERAGVRVSVGEVPDLITQYVLQFNAENGTLRGAITFSEAGEYRVVLVAEEDGGSAEASLAVSVK